jgi:hypothetical protein
MSRTVTETERTITSLKLKLKLKEEHLKKEDLPDEILEERLQEIEAIHARMELLSGVMGDLAGLVSEQGPQVQQIADNTKNTKDNTRDALSQLKKADKYQESSSWCTIS